MIFNASLIMSYSLKFSRVKIGFLNNHEIFCPAVQSFVELKINDAKASIIRVDLTLKRAVEIAQAIEVAEHHDLYPVLSQSMIILSQNCSMKMFTFRYTVC